MSEKRFSDLNDLDVIIEELEQEIDEQQAIITELERKLKKYEKIGEEQLKQIIELQDEIQQLKEKLQISEASLALLIDIILLGDVDELVKRARECARQFAEQFDKFTKEELEEMIIGGVSDE